MVCKVLTSLPVEPLDTVEYALAVGTIAQIMLSAKSKDMIRFFIMVNSPYSNFFCA
jgi:hypothetical protein